MTIPTTVMMVGDTNQHKSSEIERALLRAVSLHQRCLLTAEDAALVTKRRWRRADGSEYRRIAFRCPIVLHDYCRLNVLNMSAMVQLGMRTYDEAPYKNFEYPRINSGL